MADEFANQLVHDFNHWAVYVNQNQCYLGRCIVWCKRESAESLDEATKEELEELRDILAKLRDATKDLFGADWINYAFLGNVTRHLHCHVVPRYSGSREFKGVIFKDPLFGGNFSTDRDFVTSDLLRDGVRDALRDKL